MRKVIAQLKAIVLIPQSEATLEGTNANIFLLSWSRYVDTSVPPPKRRIVLHGKAVNVTREGFELSHLSTSLLGKLKCEATRDEM